MKYGYVVVEGQDDLEVVGRFLRIAELHRATILEQIEPFWVRVIPREFPYKGDVARRVPVPGFFQSASHSIAVQSAGGFPALVTTLEETFAILGHERMRLDAIGFIADTDQESATSRFGDLKTRIEALGTHCPDAPGAVSIGPPRTGIFLLPDNHNSGTLETLLSDCAQAVYTELLEGSRRFIDGIDNSSSSLTADDLDELGKPYGRAKAVIGCVSNVLRPGKAVQMSIHDTRWICEMTLTLPRIAKLAGFLGELLELPVVR